MFRMPFIIAVLLIFTQFQFGQSPHGTKLQIDCADCHKATAWTPVLQPMRFDHDSTAFPLMGQHVYSNCKACHATLIFEEVKQSCADCHLNIHNNSVPDNCENCHTAESWVVNNINELHANSRFPLVGSHQKALCEDCHANYSSLQFTVQSIECYACHDQDYRMAKNPDHAASGFSIDCQQCHTLISESWRGAGIDHSFFPLQGGHALSNCAACHTNGNFSGLNTDCVSCHLHTYQATTNPAHAAAGFSTDCITCHNITAWVPAQFDHDNVFFPIFSGTHNNQWDNCIDCHTGQVYSNFSCIDCHAHQQAEMAEEHDEVGGYLYESQACLACHPSGNSNGAFNHQLSQFPLSGAHVQLDCSSCHLSGTNIPPPLSCMECHSGAAAVAVNPNHAKAGFTAECSQCHSTTAWNPANYNHANTGFALTGAHSTVNCTSCHASTYVGTQSDCYSCHGTDYLNTTNPSHSAANFPQECSPCHTTIAWTPVNWNHDGDYFPIYTGSHRNEWQSCADCHTNTADFTVFSCVTCHEHNQQIMNEEHQGVNGYQYISTSCLSCHPDGSSAGAFNHSLSNFPLSGAHQNTACAECHQSGYANTPTACEACHADAATQAQNPNHSAAGLTANCTQCHQATGWIPSTFVHSTTGFTLLGAHAVLQCSNCHQGALTGLSSLCADCHTDDYTAAQNPQHQLMQLSSNCMQCHNEQAWIPSTFLHSTTGFTLTGAHLNNDCSDCHASAVTNTSANCVSCHESAFNATQNPDHELLSLSVTCETCHTTIAGWAPALFPEHNAFYPLLGAHASIASQCMSCHEGNYVTTPSDCYDCHENEYTATTNPNHLTAQFPVHCETCHTQSVWQPSTFNHDQQYFPIYSGQHDNEWNSCADCHTNSQNFSVFSCITCHEHNQQDMDNEHDEVTGYIYQSAACFDCHPDGEERHLFRGLSPRKTD